MTKALSNNFIKFYEFRFAFLSHYLGDAAYVEDTLLWFTFFSFPGVKKAKRRLNNTFNDPRTINIKYQIIFIF